MHPPSRRRPRRSRAPRSAHGPVPRRRPRGQAGPAPGVVHAPGGPLAARVPRAPRGHRHAAGLPRPRADLRDHAQPVRRHGVDAAILFSDIVVPLLRGRDRRGHRARHRSGGRAPGAHGGRCRRPARARPGAGRAGGRGRRAAAARAGRHPADRLRRCAVHARVLPRRGRPQPQPRAHQGAHVLGPGRVARPDEPPRRPHRDVPAGADRGRGRRGAALRLLGGRAVRAGLPRFVLPHSTRVLAAVADAGVPRIHFGVGTGELLGAMAEAGADVVGVDWRVPLAEAARRTGRPVCRATSTRPCCSPTRPRSRPRCAASSTTAATPRATCSTSGHGVLPETDPDVLTRLVELVHRAVERRLSARRVDGAGRRRRGGRRRARRRPPPAHAARAPTPDHAAGAARPHRRRAAHRRPRGQALRRRAPRRSSRAVPRCRRCWPSSGWSSGSCTRRGRARRSARRGARWRCPAARCWACRPARLGWRGAVARRARGGGGRARPPAGLVAGWGRGARPVAAGPLRRRADRPPRRPPPRRRLRRAGRHPRPAAHDARPRRGARRGRALPHRRRRRRQPPAGESRSTGESRSHPQPASDTDSPGIRPVGRGARRARRTGHVGSPSGRLASDVPRRSPVFGGLRGGYRVLLDALADAARADLRLGTTVRGIEPARRGGCSCSVRRPRPKRSRSTRSCWPCPRPRSRGCSAASPRSRRTRRRASSWRRPSSSRWRSAKTTSAAARHVGRAGGRG